MGVCSLRTYEHEDAEALWEAARESAGEVSRWLPWCHAEYSMAEAVLGRTGDSVVSITVRQDDLTSTEVQSLIAEHLSGMQSNSPPGHVNALAIQNLRAPSVTFWSAWLDGILCGCGALKELDRLTGEVKSMRTRSAFLRRGVGQAILDEIVRTGHRRGYSRLLLETGTGAAFEPAHALYRRNGFEWSGPFGEYTATDFNVFMSKVFSMHGAV